MFLLLLISLHIMKKGTLISFFLQTIAWKMKNAVLCTISKYTNANWRQSYVLHVLVKWGLYWLRDEFSLELGLYSYC